tara:strand:- start:156 stop:515 length:360 start_codon:yes stop_codon:yes gene_type:complete
MITVFFDGKCSICRREINYYKKISNSSNINWHDIANYPEKLNQINITQSQALKFLHALDNNNKIHIGVDAFILIWTQLKYWKLLAKFISIPIIKKLTSIIYDKFARYRFSKLYHCQITR